MKISNAIILTLSSALCFSTAIAHEGADDHSHDSDTPPAITVTEAKNSFEEALRVLDHPDLDYETKSNMLREIIAANPEQGDLWSVLGELRIEEGNDDQALQAFERAVAKDPSLHSSWHWIGILKKRQKKFEEAIMAFEKSLENGGTKAVELNEIAFTKAQLRQMDEALRIWNQAIEEDKNWGILYANAIKASLMLEQEDQARSLFLRSLSAERFDERATLIWTDHLVFDKEIKSALDDYRLALEMHPEAYRIRYYYAATLREDGEDEQAITQFQKAETDARTASDLSISSSAQKALFALKFPDKIETLTDAEEIIQKEDVSSNRDQKKLAKAAEEISEILAEHPDLWEPRMMRGIAYRRLGKMTEAQTDFEKVLEFAPEQPNAFLNLGLLHQDKGETEKAVEYGNRAREIAPRDPLIVVNSILILANANECAQAMEALKVSRGILTNEMIDLITGALEGNCS